MNFTIMGERCSGTKLLKQAIEANFGLDFTGDYGWKHWVGWQDDKIKNAKDTIFFCIARNVFDWCHSFYKKPHHVEHLRHNFFHSTWYSLAANGEEIMEDRNFHTNKRYKNIFELRSVKLKYMYNLDKIQKNTYKLSYEKLCINYDDVMYNIGQAFNLERLPNALYPELSTHELTHDLKRLIREKTDWEAESLWGYKNDYIS